MLFERFLAASSNVYVANRLLLVTVGALVLAAGLLSYQLAKERDSRMTTLVPLTVTGPMEVGDHTASPEYLRAMARYITNLGFTYTAQNARPQFEELMFLFAPEAIEGERRRWLEIAERIEKIKRISRTYFIEDIQTPKAGLIEVKGFTVRRLGTQLEQTRATIRLGYRITHGRFWIEKIETERPNQQDKGTTTDLTIIEEQMDE